ncbi:MAG: DinB family protein [Thermoanaerobaculia bacterium]
MSFDFASRPGQGEYGDFHVGYIAAVPAGDIRETLARESAAAEAFYGAIPEGLCDHAYAPGKWTIREVVAHLADSERVFAYRALRFGRADPTPLAGFDQDRWVPECHAGTRKWSDLLGDFSAVRTASLHLFRSFAEVDWARRGEASGVPVSVRTLAFVIAGHELHHRRILAERYGVA